MASGDLSWWFDGDVLHVIAVRKGDIAILCCAVQAPMTRLLDSDIWTVAVRVADARRAVIDIGVIPATNPGARIVWRGPQAPPQAASVKTLAGRIETQKINSRWLDAERALTVYLPPGFDATRRYPVAYVADGVGVSEYARFIEPLIVTGRIAPVVMIGLNSAPDPQRAQDYLVGFRGKDDFSRHDAFFLKEVIPLAERVYGASRDPRMRLLIGQSNGGSWAVTTALRHPRLFGHAAGLSPGWRDAMKPLGDMPKPAFFLAVGTLESFLPSVTAMAGDARAAGYKVEFVTRVSGHSELMWSDLYPLAFEWAFAPAPRAGAGAP
ncbi:MAG: alpha/beta hydrolase [Phenylobacterium sp.]